MFVNFGEAESDYILPIISRFRQEGISSEIYPESTKMKKQMSYADSNNIPYVAIIGEDEKNSHMIMLKNMQTGTQELLSADECINTLRY